MSTMIHAADTCRARGWGPGTVLASAKWRTTKELCAIDAHAVVLRYSCSHRTEQRKLPADVYATHGPIDKPPRPVQLVTYVDDDTAALVTAAVAGGTVAQFLRDAIEEKLERLTGA